eukprot:scaffold21131_cov134-Isochrysis_galbana.AAC.8
MLYRLPSHADSASHVPVPSALLQPTFSLQPPAAPPPRLPPTTHQQPERPSHQRQPLTHHASHQPASVWSVVSSHQPTAHRCTDLNIIYELRARKPHRFRWSGVRFVARIRE